jgi:hypothetical protein
VLIVVIVAVVVNSGTTPPGSRHSGVMSVLVMLG